LYFQLINIIIGLFGVKKVVKETDTIGTSYSRQLGFVPSKVGMIFIFPTFSS
jgi:hypothetical protein